jgi:hypothetical protein
VEGNTEFRKQILAGRVDQGAARDHEKECLRLLVAYDKEEVSIREVGYALESYEQIVTGRAVRSAFNEETLAARPWTKCKCAICKVIGIHVVIFRGAERNRRRGFHNLYVFSNQLRRHLLPAPEGRQDAAISKNSTKKETSYA